PVDCPAVHGEKDFPMHYKCLLSDKLSTSSCAVMVLNLDGFDYWLCPIREASGNAMHGYTLTMYNAKDLSVERRMARRNGIAALGGKVSTTSSTPSMPSRTFNYYKSTRIRALARLARTTLARRTSLNACTDMYGVDAYETASLDPALKKRYLVKSCGELFLVFVFFDGQNTHKIA
ncbi:uncharacterized protein LOC133929622, partial [Phragmites australis]|uniref:uncharacterized protein LOC133929622 n=1 Tax=Phragmites australis TaxID=29695 RepID=UPI002D77C222